MHLRGELNGGVAGAIASLALPAVGGGVVARYVPYPLVAGFMVGAAALIIIAQVPALTGISKIDLRNGPAAIWTALQPLTLLVVGAATIAVMSLASVRMSPCCS